MAPLCAASTTWYIGAQKFTPNKTGTEITRALCETVPSAILEHIGNSLNRDVTPDEKFQRRKYELETARLSLFLQLSSEYKKRDALVLGDYTKGQYKRKLKEEEKKIAEIEEQIAQNIETQKKELETAIHNQAEVDSGKYKEQKVQTEGQKWIYLFSHMFLKDEDLISEEQIAFYGNDAFKLFSPSAAAIAEGPESYTFGKEVNSAKINTLLCGKVTNYGEYVSVNVDAYLFPGANKIASVMEVGAVREVDFIASSIAAKLVPYITNSLPIELDVKITPEDANDVKFYFNEALLDLNEKIIQQSGIHNIQIQAPGYKSISTTYNFKGNQRYLIEVNLEPEIESFAVIQRKKADGVTVFANGEKAEEIDPVHSRIKVNGKTILGQFVNTDGLSGFFYVPSNKNNDGLTLKANMKLRDTSTYIDKRRKWMYGSYSALMVSLIPYFVFMGEYNEKLGIFYLNKNLETYNDAKKWSDMAQYSVYASVGCGIWFGYELVRYLLAANSVLPKKATATSFVEYEAPEPPEPPEISEDSLQTDEENINTDETTDKTAINGEE